MITALSILFGLAALFGGGTLLVRGASAAALSWGLSPFVVGLTVVGFGTSAPELMVSLDAASGGASGIAIGNVVGSNIANILLILGLTALIGPVSARFADVRMDLGWMLAAAVVCVAAFWNGGVGRVEGAALITALAVYLAITLTGPREEIDLDAPRTPVWRALAIAAVGLAILLVGARLLVDGGTDLARLLGVSEAAIGLTVVAVGTSLPELATSIIAALRGDRHIALGNVVGSNIFNVFAILGITAAVAPIPVDPRFLAFDVPVMIAASLALATLVAAGLGVGRAAGLGFLGAYAGYVACSTAL